MALSSCNRATTIAPMKASSPSVLDSVEHRSADSTEVFAVAGHATTQSAALLATVDTPMAPNRLMKKSASLQRRILLHLEALRLKRQLALSEARTFKHSAYGGALRGDFHQPVTKSLCSKAAGRGPGGHVLQSA